MKNSTAPLESRRLQGSPGKHSIRSADDFTQDGPRPGGVSFPKFGRRMVKVAALVRSAKFASTAFRMKFKPA